MKVKTGYAFLVCIFTFFPFLFFPHISLQCLPEPDPFSYNTPEDNACVLATKANGEWDWDCGTDGEEDDEDMRRRMRKKKDV